MSCRSDSKNSRKLSIERQKSRGCRQLAFLEFIPTNLSGDVTFGQQTTWNKAGSA